MKKISLALLAGTMVFASCKKGENDPAISLISRKARVAGEWTVDKYVSSTTDVNGTTTDVTTETFDGASYSKVLTHTTGATSVSSTLTGTVALNKVTFEKEGTFKQEQTYTTTETESMTGYTQVTTVTHTDVLEGSWNFLGKVDEFKNKERIALNYTSFKTDEKTVVVETYTGLPSTTTTSETANSGSIADGEYTEVWALDRLASDEMVVKGDLGNTSTYSSTNPSGVTTTTTQTTTGTLEINLSQE